MKTLSQLVKAVLIHRINKRKKVETNDNMREANFNAWKEKHDKEVKKCYCEIPQPRPTYLNECWKCNGEIYKDYTDRVRWYQKEDCL